MHMTLAVLPNVILSVGIISTLLLAVGLQWGFAAEEDRVTIRGLVRDEAGRPVYRLLVRCTDDSTKKTLGVLFPNNEGVFTLPIARSVETITCGVDPDPLKMFEHSSMEPRPVPAR